MSYPENLARHARIPAGQIPIEVDTAQDARDALAALGYPAAFITRGALTKGDGGGGHFYPIEGAPETYTDDLGMRLLPTGGDGSLALERDTSYHPNGIPVQAFGIIGDGSCEWAKWEAMLQALGGDIGGDEMRGEPISVADPVSAEREFVIRGPLFARDNITLRVAAGCGIRNANITSAAKKIGAAASTNLSGAVFWAGSFSPEYLPDHPDVDNLGKMAAYALEEAEPGSYTVELSTAGDATYFTVGDRVLVRNSYRNLLTIVDDIDGATLTLRDPIFWPLTQLPSAFPEYKNYLYIVNFSTAHGRGTQQYNLQCGSDALFSGPEYVDIVPHAVRNFSIICEPGGWLKSDAFPVSSGKEAWYEGEITGGEWNGVIGFYHNALSHVPHTDVHCRYRRRIWEFADGYYNSPMTRCIFSRDTSTDRFEVGDPAIVSVRLGQLCHHKTIKVFDDVPWGNTGGASLSKWLTSDGFDYSSTIEDFDFVISGEDDVGYVNIIEIRAAAAADHVSGENADVNPYQSEAHKRLHKPRATTLRNGVITITSGAVYRYLSCESWFGGQDEGAPQDNMFDNVIIKHDGDVRGQGILLAADSGGVIRNCTIPGILYLPEQSRAPIADGLNATDLWTFDNLQVDEIYNTIGGWDGSSNDEEAVSPIEFGGVTGGRSVARVPRAAKILRRGMLPLLAYEDYGYQHYRAGTGDLFQINIPPGLPWVLHDEVELRISLFLVGTSLADTVLTLYDRGPDTDLWQTVFSVTQPSGSGAEAPNYEDMWRDLVIRMRVSDLTWETGDRREGVVRRIVYSVDYSGPVGVTRSVKARGNRPAAVDNDIDLNSDGRQLRLHVDRGAASAATRAVPQIKCNLRWWPR